MEKFASTDTLMSLLESGKYKCLVMKNEEEGLDTEEAFETLAEKYIAATSRPNNYDYFSRREILPKEEHTPELKTEMAQECVVQVG
jgi:hypothetical protein